MTATTYALTDIDWTDCGAADDCTLQGLSVVHVIFTVGASKPATNSNDGIRLSNSSGFETSATVSRPGLKVWARAGYGAATLTVER